MNNIFSIYSAKPHYREDYSKIKPYSKISIVSSKHLPKYSLPNTYKTDDLDKQLLNIENYTGNDRLVLKEISQFEKELFDIYFKKTEKKFDDQMIVSLASIVINNPNITSERFLEEIEILGKKVNLTLACRLLRAFRCYIHFHNNSFIFATKETKYTSYQDAFDNAPSYIARYLKQINKYFNNH